MPVRVVPRNPIPQPKHIPHAHIFPTHLRVTLHLNSHTASLFPDGHPPQLQNNYTPLKEDVPALHTPTVSRHIIPNHPSTPAATPPIFPHSSTPPPPSEIPSNPTHSPPFSLLS